MHHRETVGDQAFADDDFDRIAALGLDSQLFYCDAPRLWPSPRGAEKCEP